VPAWAPVVPLVPPVADAPAPEPPLPAAPGLEPPLAPGLPPLVEGDEQDAPSESQSGSVERSQDVFPNMSEDE
jgi:hypothetical protein